MKVSQVRAAEKRWGRDRDVVLHLWGSLGAALAFAGPGLLCLTGSGALVWAEVRALWERPPR